MQKTTREQINLTLMTAASIFRGTLDTAFYKDYILTMFFIKYLSDSYKEFYDECTFKYNGDETRIKRALSRAKFIFDKMPVFDYLYEKKNDPNIGEIINKELDHLAELNKAKLEGIFKNIDFNAPAILSNNKNKNYLLISLLDVFDGLDLRPSILKEPSVVGDAYEDMISKFATDSGKSGDFFTPVMVAELLSRLVKPEENDRIYDPTCGSGSLLIRGFNKVSSGNVQIYGQEKNLQTYSLCKMNMFLHGIYDAKIANGDTLTNPRHLENGKLMKFQVVAGIIPFSLDNWAVGFLDNYGKYMDASLDPYGRFEWGVPPLSKGDFAFILHMLYSLAEDGRMAVVVPHGVLFRGANEGKIRQKILEENLLEAVIGLPENLLFGTGIPVAVLVFKKNRKRQDVIFIDASGYEHYEKDKYRNKLREEDLVEIEKVYDKYETIDKFSYVATFDEIKENDYNLNIPRYVDTFNEETSSDLTQIANNITKIKTKINSVEEEIFKYLEELKL